VSFHNQSNDPLDLLVEGKPRRVDLHRVGGRAERGYGSLGILTVAAHQPVGLGTQVGLFGPFYALFRQAAPGTLARIGDQEDLQLGIRKDNRSYVAAISDQV
jgi:hypothetical protein